MKATVKKEWEHSRAPIDKTSKKRIYKKGDEIEINQAGFIDGVKAGFLVNPEEGEKKETATSKSNKQTR